MTRQGFLLDTHVILWALSDSPRLPARHREILADGSACHVSAVSIWEIAIKKSLGKLDISDGFLDILEETQAIFLPVTPRHANHILGLAHHHRDPFDRMLIAQAQIERLSILTVDRHFAEYDVEVI